MTRRERLERRAEQRREWAEKRDERSEQEAEKARKTVEHIPLGQPILVGHHSERTHRNTIDRAHRAMGRAVESRQMARKHRSKAAGIEDQLDRSIFSDDEDAVGRLAAKIAGLEALRDRMKAVQAAWRKAGKPAHATDGDVSEHMAMWRKIAAAGELTDEELLRALRGMALDFTNRGPFPSYALSNLGANIRRLRKRVEQVENRQERAERAEAAGGVVIEGDEYVRVTFAEKPPRETLNELKAAGFRWGGGSWAGKRENLPESVVEATESGAA
jgi:hypothetical protein